MISRSAVACLCVLMCLAVISSAGQTYRYEFKKTVQVGAGLELTVNNTAGNIIITTNGESSLSVEAVKNINADNQSAADDIAKHIEIDVSRTGNHFTVEPKYTRIDERTPSFWQKIFGKSGEQSFGTVDLVISVPVECNTDIYSTAGNIEIAGLTGKLYLSGSGGSIKVRDIQGKIDITTTSGEVSLNDINGNIRINASGSSIAFSSITGDLEIRNSSGKTVGEYLSGALTLSQTIGTVELKRIEGNIRIKSTSSKIDIEQDAGALDVTTETGDVNIKTELSSSNDYFVETISGSINFMIPSTSGGNINMEASSGDIDARIPISIDSFSKTRLSGTFGGGGPKISLSTRSGDITLLEFE